MRRKKPLSNAPRRQSSLPSARGRPGIVGILYQRSQFAQALRRAKDLLRRDPENLSILDLAAHSALALHQNAEAEEFWMRAIEVEPDFVDARYNLGLAQQRAGRLEAAERSFRQLLDISVDHAAALNALGTLLMQQERLQEAIPYLQHAVAIDASDARAFANLGLALLEVRRYADAEAALDEALRLAPKLPEALYNRALLDMVLGLTQRADQHLDAALEANPSYARALMGKVMLNSKPGSPVWLSRLEASYAQRKEQSAEAGIVLNFAMGQVREQQCAYQEAFEAYSEGNRLHFDRHPFDEAREIHATNLVRDAFEPTLYTDAAALASEPDDASPIPIFVVGMPRSGTTLVEQILASHTAIHGAGELTILGEPASAVHAIPDATEDRTAWHDQLRELGAQYIERVWQDGIPQRFVVDKLPDNYHYLGLVPLMLPNAKIIHITRDPLDTCWSCFATLFRSGHDYSYDLGTLGRHYRRYQRLMEYWNLILPRGSMLEVHYEALVADLERESRRMLEFVGLPWDTACLRFHETRRPVNTASFIQVRQPLYGHAIARWRHFQRHLEPLREALKSPPTI